MSDDAPVTIGRSIGRLRLHDSRVSKDHAEIVFDGVSWILRDLGSSNGSYVNGERLIGLAELERGDTLQFGRIRIKVREANRAGVQHIDLETAGLAGPAIAPPATRPAPPTPVTDDVDNASATPDGPIEFEDEAIGERTLSADDGEGLDLDALFAEADEREDEDEADHDVAVGESSGTGYTNQSREASAPPAAPDPGREADEDAVPIEDTAAELEDDAAGSSVGGINIESGVFDPVPGAAGWQIEQPDVAPDDSGEYLGGSAEAKHPTDAVTTSGIETEEAEEAVNEAEAVAESTDEVAVEPAAPSEPAPSDDEVAEDPADSERDAEPDAGPAAVADDAPPSSADQIRIDDELPNKPASGGTTLKLPHETLAAAAGSDRSASMSDASKELRAAQDREDNTTRDEDAIGLADDQPSVFDEATTPPPASGPEPEPDQDHDHDLIRIGDDTPIGSAPAVLDERELTPTTDAAASMPTADGLSSEAPPEPPADTASDRGSAEPVEDEAEHVVPDTEATHNAVDADAVEPVPADQTPDAVSAPQGAIDAADIAEDPQDDEVTLEALLAAEEASAAGSAIRASLDADDEDADQAEVAVEGEPQAEVGAHVPATLDASEAADATEPFAGADDADETDQVRADVGEATHEDADPEATQHPAEKPSDGTAPPPEHLPPASPVDVSQLRAALAKLHGPGDTPTLAAEADAADVVSSIIDSADADTDTQAQEETDGDASGDDTADTIALNDQDSETTEPASTTRDPGETDCDAPSPASFAAGLGTADAVAEELDRDEVATEHAAIVEAATQSAAERHDADLESQDESAAPLAAQPPPGINPTSTRPPTEPRTSRRSVPGYAIHPPRRRVAIAAGILLLIAAAAATYFSGVITLPTIAGRDTPGLPNNPAPDPGLPSNNPGSNPPRNIPPTNPRNIPGPGTNPPTQPTPNSNAVDPFTNTARVLGAAALAGRTTDDRSVRVPVDPNTPTTDPPTDPGTTPRNPNNLPPLVIPDEGGTPTNPADDTQANNPDDASDGSDMPTTDNTNPAVPADGDRLVFLVDCSGSLVDSLPQMLLWLRDAIDTLGPNETFTIIFFKQDQAIETPPAGLQPLTRTYQRTLIADWLDDNASPVLPAGRSDPTAGLQLALSYNPSDIYLLSDESFGQRTGDTTPRQAVRYVTELIADADLRIHGIQFFYDDTDGALQNLAEQFGGTYEFVEETRHPDRDPIDLLEELENRNR